MSERRPRHGKSFLNEFDVTFKQTTQKLETEKPEEKEKIIVIPGEAVIDVVERIRSEASGKKQLMDLVPDLAERGIIYFRDVGYIYPPFHKNEETTADFNTDYLKQRLDGIRRFGLREMIHPTGIFYEGDKCVLRMMVHLGDELEEGKHYVLDLREFQFPLSDLIAKEKGRADPQGKPYGPKAKIRLIPASMKWYEFKGYQPVNPLPDLNFRLEEADDEGLASVISSFGWEIK
jgi:hypothetical protein